MRTFGSGVLEALQNEAAEERVFLVKFIFSGGSIYTSTGSRDLFWDGQTWEAIGGNLTIGGIEESGDLKGQGVDITLSGVDQTIIAVLLAQNYRGRTLQVWQAILNQQTGVVLDTIDLFSGLQLDRYEIEEQVKRGQPLTATIKTRGRHRLSVKEYRGIRSNVHAHQQYFPGDTFFQHAPSLGNKKVYWGTEAPSRIGGGIGDPGGGEGIDDDTRILG